MKTTTDLCGVPLWALLLAGAGGCAAGEEDAARARFAESLSRLADKAERLDARIAVEPQNRFQSSFLRTAAESRDFVNRLGTERVGLVVDTFHMNIEEGSWAEPFRQAGARLFHVHFADSHRGVPGTGLIPFERVRQNLEFLRYDGWVSIEIEQRPDPAAAARAAIDAWRRIMGLDTP